MKPALQHNIASLARIEASPIDLPQGWKSACPPELMLVGYHHCPALCNCSSANLIVFGLDSSVFHRGLVKSLLSWDGLRKRLDETGPLGWRVLSLPPCDLQLDTVQAVSATLPEAEQRQGLVVPVYGPYARKGLFFFEHTERAALPAVPDELQVLMLDFHVAMSRRIADSQQHAELTEREADVTRWIVYGKSNPVIAEILDISAHTVNGYLRRIFLKTGTSNRVSLAIYAVNHGLV